MRIVVAITIGVCLTLVLAYAALIGFVLATIGIPLGAQSEPPSPSGYMTMLLLGGVAATAGGRVAVSIGRVSPRLIAAGMAATLTVLMLWGFGGRNSWPDWWASALSGVMVAGTCIGALRRRRSSRS
jgi:hypothetical protein